MSASPAVISVCLARNLCLFRRNWFDNYLRFTQKIIEATARDWITATINDRGCFYIV